MRLVGLLCLLLLAACGVDETLLHLRHKGADMPIRVRGNEASGVLVVFAAGGPGAPVEFFARQPAFRRLEEDFAFAWWEQRGTANAQGDAPPETMTLAQFTEDLGLAIELLRERYPEHAILLMSNSFAGGFATPLVADPAQAAKLRGWVSVAGLWDVPRARVLSRLWAIERAEQRIAEGADAARWREALAYYEATPQLTPDNWDRHYAYVEALGGNRAPPDDALGLLTTTSLSIGAYLRNAEYATRSFSAEFRTMAHGPLLAHITLPSLLVYGRDDGRYPLALAEELHDGLGTAPGRKRLEVFEHSSHNPYWEEPDRFVESVRRFVREQVGAP